MTHTKQWIAASVVAMSLLIPAMARAGLPVMTAPTTDQSLAAQIPAIERAIDILQQAHEDYNGDRTRAVGDLNQAETDLRAALQTNNQTRPTPYPIPYVAPQAPGGTTNGVQAQSDEMLVDARTIIESSEDQLQRDVNDYGGYRVKAVAELQASIVQLDDALSTSDRNIVATAGLLDHAVTVLQGGKEDYSGHRTLAIEAINHARVDISRAIRAANIAGGNTAARIAGVWQSPGGNPQTTQVASNELLREARAMVSSAIDQLQHDAHDYAGQRVAAIGELQGAISQIDTALAIVHG